LIDRTSFFGPLAEAVAGRLPAGLHAIVDDETGVTGAYREAVRRRERGERFYLLLLADDRRVTVCNKFVNALNVQYTNGDDRQVLADQLSKGLLKINGEVVANHWLGAHPFGQAARELAGLCDELLVRSYSEYERLLTFGCFPKQFRRILLKPNVPAMEPHPALTPCVVVWPGSRPASDLTLALIGLEQFRGKVIYVAKEQLPNVRGQFVAFGAPNMQAALESASCIVCVDAGDPSDAVELAKRGKSVVAAATSGAHEFAVGVVPWDAGSAMDLATCVAIAHGRETIGGSPDDIPLVPRAPEAPASVTELPLVTILIPTYNRREYLKSVLECVAAQTYPRIEAIVVNDGGEAVEDIVAAFPVARCVNAETNGGTISAFKIGLDMARGEYIQMLPDDDWLYPDHVERIMYAILRSGAAWGHSCSLLRFQKRDAAGALQAYGYNASCYSATVTPMQALVGTPIAGHQCLQRRDTFDADDVGWYLNLVGTDQEYHMRLLERYSPVMVDQHTCEFRDHPSNQGRGFDWSEAMREVYEDVHPLPDRPHIVDRRRQTLEALRLVPRGQNVNRPSITF
jgi:hypothetical protein